MWCTNLPCSWVNLVVIPSGSAEPSGLPPEYCQTTFATLWHNLPASEKFWDRVSGGPAWPWTHYTAKDDLKLLTSNSEITGVYQHVIYEVLGIEPRDSFGYSTNWVKFTELKRWPSVFGMTNVISGSSEIVRFLLPNLGKICYAIVVIGHSLSTYESLHPATEVTSPDIPVFIVVNSLVKD